MRIFRVAIVPPGVPAPKERHTVAAGDSVFVSLKHHRNGTAVGWEHHWFNRTGETVQIEFVHWEEAPDDGSEAPTQALQPVQEAQAGDGVSPEPNP